MDVGKGVLGVLTAVAAAAGGLGYRVVERVGVVVLIGVDVAVIAARLIRNRRRLVGRVVAALADQVVVGDPGQQLEAAVLGVVVPGFLVS
ncbi:MAG: hypothetical protein MUC77_12080 [Chromatiaceae bacterium]|nr:hypothetical protein [Chromatiaceae bacterium]